MQETTGKEPLMKCRKRTEDVKTGRRWLTRDQSEILFTALMTSGTKAA